MGILLIFFSFISTLVVIHSLNREKIGLRISWLGACLVIGVLIVASTEGLSVFHALTQTSLLIFWGAVLALAIFLIFKRKVYRFRFSWSVFENRWLNLTAAFIPLALLGATFVIAIVAPPNNSDAMVYHLSRVAHWAQAHSVAHFATSTLRELFLNPLAEYAILHTYLLSGSDRYANLIQWFSYFSGALLVSLITEQLGGSKRAQYLAALFAMTVPQAVLQATSTQNDLTFSAFGLIAIYLILRFVQEGARRWLILTAAATGLAVLAKSISFVVLAPFILWAFYKLLRSWKKTDILACGLALLVAALLVFPFYLRNAQTFGSLLGPASETDLYKNDQFNLKVLASNTIRNLAINLTYTGGINAAEEQAVTGFHRLINLSESDPGTTWQGYQFSIQPFTVSEDKSGSPLHIWLLLVVLVVMVAARKRFSSSSHWLAICLAAGFLLFSAYLKWQPWNNRLELVFFLVAAPLFGLVLEKTKLLQLLFTAGLFLYSLPYFYFNPTKPLTQDWNIFNLPRIEMMIRTKDILAPYINSAFYLRDETDCDQIGMDLMNGAWEYPFWNMLVDVNHPQRTLEHVNVTNESRSLESQTGNVCAILFVNDEAKGQSTSFMGEQYTRSFYEQPVGVYIKQR